MPKLRQFIAVCGLLGLVGCGHVDRRMKLTSEPEGALVYLNGQEVGRTPCTVDFTWYGRYEVILRKEGWQTFKGTQQVSGPWWQWIPLDLMADLTPGRKIDEHAYAFTLEPLQKDGVDPQVLIDRAKSMRPSLESGEFTRKPATRPATQPTTTSTGGERP